jgi:hypothetical protein
VVLSRAKEQHVAGLEIERTFTDSHGRPSAKYQVQLRLGMEVSRTSVRRAVEPSLGATTRKHGKRLKYLHVA